MTTFVMPNKSPNILLIQADQLTASALPTYGNSTASTPSINSLSDEATVFSSAYANSPLCAPSRSSMLTGHLPSEIGTYDNGAEFPSSIPTIAHYLRHLGYQTSLAGKAHFVGADQHHGLEERLTGDIYPSDFGWTGDWGEKTQAHSNDARSFTMSGPVVRNVQIDHDEEVIHRAKRKLYDLARSSDTRPFFFWVSLTHPHDPYQAPQEYWDRYDDEDIDLPAVPRLADEDQDPLSLRLLDQYGLADQHLTKNQVRRARHGYYAAVSYLDDLVGSLLESLGDAGLDSDTVIVFTSDHGDMLGERGLWYKKSFFEDSARVPLIIRVPGGDPGDVEMNVSLVDLLPTLVALAGGNPDRLRVEELDGTDLSPALKGHADGLPDTVYSENLAEGALAPVLMVRKGRYKYIVSGIDPPLLFDLANDPLELDNLAGAEEHQSTEKALRRLVDDRWDIEALTVRIERSQARRLFINETLGQGEPGWDHVPGDPAAANYLRPDRTYNEWAHSSTIRADT